MPDLEIIEADLDRPDHQRAVVELLDAYARDPLGDGKPLAADVRARLIPGLREHPMSLVWLAWNGSDPVGIAVCFRGFSTFKARPLINIHDLAVQPDYRGRGIGKRLLQAVERKAVELGCCKLTLEVLENNRAKQLYESCGFAQATYEEAAGGALFMAKVL